MTLQPAARLDAITPSLTLSLDDRVRTLIAEGRPIVNLTVGQPDFDTPKYVCDAAAKAIAEGFTRYTSPVGIIELRKAAARWFAEKSGIEYRPSQVMVSSGSKHALFNALQTIVPDGDEVIVPAPYWVSYPDLVRMAGAIPVHPSGTFENGYKLTPADLTKAITPKTRAIILNSPSNPTGSVYSPDETRALSKVLLEHQVAVISDEIYDRIVYDGVEPLPFAAAYPEMRDLTITVNGVSKAYAMTGWRIGFAAGPEKIIEAMGRYQAQATGNPCSVSQKAALAAITGTGAELDVMCRAFARRRDFVIQELRSIPLIDYTVPQGAFYFLLRIDRALGRLAGGETLRTSEDVAALLLENGVALVPGTGFGAPDCLRLSFAASDDDIRRGLEVVRGTFQAIQLGTELREA